MKRISQIALLFFAPFVTASYSVSAQPDVPPRFEDYPIAKMFTGKPASPRLVTSQQKAYRTRIREGVAEGGPNFAGHYIVVTWACGSPCGMMAIVDAVTGKVYNPPLSQDLSLPSWPEDNPENPALYIPWVADVEFRPDSRLMIVKANPDPSEGRTSYAHYFLLQNEKWKLLRRIPLPPRTF